MVEKKNLRIVYICLLYTSFARRLDKEFERLDYCGVNACRNFYEVNQAGAWNILKSF